MATQVCAADKYLKDCGTQPRGAWLDFYELLCLKFAFKYVQKP